MNKDCAWPRLAASEVGALPGGPVRKVLLGARKMEYIAETDIGWGIVAPVIFVFSQPLPGCSFAHVTPVTPMVADLAEGLRILAGTIACNPTHIVPLTPGYLGVGLITEGWRYARPGRHERGQPETVGAVEIRALVGHTQDGNIFMLHRIRGEEPTIRYGASSFDAYGVLQNPIAQPLARLHRILSDRSE